MNKLLLCFFIFLTVSLSAFAQETVTVIAIKANLRGTPDSKGVIVTTVLQDETFELIKTKGAWYLVQTPKYVGWLHGNSIKIDEEDNAFIPQRKPKPTTKALSSQDDSPFQSEYVGGDKVSIVVTNSAEITLNLTFGGIKYVISKGKSETIEADGGAYEFLATAPGVKSKSGIRQFDAGFRYTWEFWVVYR